MTVVGILGLGEVGRALCKLEKTKNRVLVRDLKFDQIKDSALDVAHVCIPYTKQFIQAVKKFLQQTKPNLAIIHSTVKPTTTNALYQLTRVNLVHSPILGIHNQKSPQNFRHQIKSQAPQTLYDFLINYPKLIGPTTPTSFRLAKTHFELLGIKVERFNSPLETELAKILSTTYYGWNIIFEKWVHQLCQEQKADFQEVYTRYNRLYNQVYSRSLPHLTRPVIAHHPGPIGGHCVIPNAKILNQYLQDEFSNFLLDQNKKFRGPKTQKKSQNSPKR